MRNHKSTEFIHALRTYMSEVECEYPDLTLKELAPMIADAATRAAAVTELGGSPAQTARICIAEQLDAQLIPPWA